MIANLINRYKAWCFAPTREYNEYMDDRALWNELFSWDIE